jgi:hypothetical protein
MPDESPSPSPAPPAPSVLLILCRDLLFASRITAAAQAQGLPFKVIREPAKLAGEAGRKLIVDLNLDGAIDAAAAWSRQTSRPTTGFVSHVDTATIRRAREAGIERVLPRSQFTQQLDRLL